MLLSQWFVLSSVLLACAGCKQGEGERCEVNSDCSSGLTCDVSVGGGSSIGVNGICRSGSSAIPTIDASIKIDTRTTFDSKVDGKTLEVAAQLDGLKTETSLPTDTLSTDTLSTDTRSMDSVRADVTLGEDVAADVPLPSDSAQDQAPFIDASDSRVD